MDIGADRLRMPRIAALTRLSIPAPTVPLHRFFWQRAVLTYKTKLSNPTLYRSHPLLCISAPMRL
jgi:hypothetical protein